MGLMLFIRTKMLQLENETIALNGHIQVIFLLLTLCLLYRLYLVTKIGGGYRFFFLY